MTVPQRPRRGTFALMMAVFVLARAGSVAAAQPPPAAAGSQPPPKLTAEQKKWLYDHGHMSAGAYPLAIYSSGRPDQALALVEQALALARAAFGDADELVALPLAELAEIQARRGDFPAARKAAQEVLAIRRKKHPETHWRVTEARLALEKIERWAALPPEKRQQLVKAEQVLGDSWERLKPGRFMWTELPPWCPPIEVAVELQRQLFGEKDLDYARGLRQIAAFMASEDSSSPRRVELNQKALGILQERLGEKHPECAISWRQMGDFYRNNGQLGQAMPLFGLAAAIYLESLGARDVEYDHEIDACAVFLRVQGDSPRARTLLEKEVGILKATLGEHDPRYARGLYRLAWVYETQGAFVQAEPLHQKAVEVVREVYGENHPEYRSALRSLLDFYSNKGAPREVLAPMESRLREIAKEIRASNERTLEHAWWLTTLAQQYRDKWLDLRFVSWGDGSGVPTSGNELVIVGIDNNGLLHIRIFDAGGKRITDTDETNLSGLQAGAISSLKRQLQFLLPPRVLLDGEKAQFVSRLTSIFGRTLHQGAEEYLQPALAIYKETVGETSPQYIDALSLLADLTKDQSSAQAARYRVQELTRQSRSSNSFRYLQQLRLKAKRYESAKANDKAEATLREVVELCKKNWGEKNAEYAQSLVNLASFFTRTRDYALAEPIYLEALGVYKTIEGKKGNHYSEILFTIGMHYQKKGDQAREREYYRKFLQAIKEATDDPNGPWADRRLDRWLFYNWMMFISKTGMNDAVEPVLHQCLTIDEQVLEDGLVVQSERERLQTLRKSLLVDYLYVAITLRCLPAEHIYQHILAYKGAALRLSENRLVRDQPELKELLDKLAAVRQRLAQLAYTPPSAGQQDDRSRQLTRAREDKQFLESELARRSEPFRRQLERRHLAPADVARALPPGVVLVDLFTLDFRRSTSNREREVRQIACVISNGRPVACVELSASFWERLRPFVTGARTVLVAPDRSNMSLAVLPGRQPGSYLIEDVAIGYVTSGRQVVEIFSEPARNDGHGLLAVGGVDYTAEPGASTTRLLAQADLPGLSAEDRAGFTFLAGTLVESRRCEQLFRQVFPAEPVTLLEGAAAQEGRLKQELTRRYRYLHLATHGFFASPERINSLRLKVQPAASGPAAAPQPGQTPWSEDLSWLESGVVLAGAGRTPQPVATGQEDGILSAEEVAALDLRGTELVTLSACDTARGRIARGQGVLGLQQAFAAAGARTLVTTLWPVDDVTTVILMDEFYQNLWQKKLPKLEALRQAQLTVLKQPELVRRRRQELKAEFVKLGLKRDLELEGPATPANAVQAAPRTDPKLWGAFILSGDIR